VPAQPAEQGQSRRGQDGRTPKRARRLSLSLVGLLAVAAFAVLVGAIPSGAIGRWSAPQNIHLNGGQRNELFGVSCTSLASCTAVGDYTNAGGYYQTLIGLWDGVGWTLASSTGSSTTLTQRLFDVSCTSSTACIAVGHQIININYQTLIGTWDGTTWTIAAGPNTSVSQNNSLSGVSCTSSSACTAVGEYVNASHYQTLVENWNGISWTIVASPNTSTTQDNFLPHVSCTSSSACTAAGEYVNASGHYQTLVENWDGTAWTIVASPNTSTTQDNKLNDVSCISSSSCTAVGTYFEAPNYKTLVENWDGTAWTIAASPNASNSWNMFHAVSCASSWACTAVGEYYNAGGYIQTLIETRDGGNWTIEESPNSSTKQGNDLYGVTCNSSSACTAVGVCCDNPLVLSNYPFPVGGLVDMTVPGRGDNASPPGIVVLFAVVPVLMAGGWLVAKRLRVG
jgi:hypothetical protein